MDAVRGADLIQRHKAGLQYINTWWETSLIVLGSHLPSAVQCRYNAVNFLLNPHKMHTIAHPLGRDMGCKLWCDTLIYILLQSA